MIQSLRPSGLGRFLLLILGILIISSSPGGARDVVQDTGTDLQNDPRLDGVLKFVLEGSRAKEGSSLAPLVDAPETPTILSPDQYGEATAQDQIALVVAGNVDRGDLERLGAQVNTQVAGYSTVQAPVALIPAIMQTRGVERVTAASPLTPMSDASMDSINADAAWNGELGPLFENLSGAGVVIGVIDSGLDAEHGDFRKLNNNTRIKYAWSQINSNASPPSGFTYGAEYTEAMINAGQYNLFDNVGHGTHTTGIAAGNDGQYSGVAPEADIIFVQSTLQIDTRIVDGVNYIFQKAQSMGKPAVVLLSMGTQKGPHDGSYWLDEAISGLTGNGKIVVAAAGNYGDQGVHASRDIPNGQNGTFVFNIPNYTPNGGDQVRIEGWHDAGASFRMRLTSPTGLNSPWVDPGEDIIWDSSAGYCMIANDQNSTSSGAELMEILFWGTPGIAEGNWTITLDRESGTSSGRADFWFTYWILGTPVAPEFTVPDYGITITSPATADDVISIGSFWTKARWTNIGGGTSGYGSRTNEGKVSDFSAFGPRRDGVQRPDLVAPGMGVAAAYASESYYDTWALVPGGKHIVKAGTSMAAAHAAGAVALLLEEADMQGGQMPDPNDIRASLLSRAKRDENTGFTFDPQYGNGKLCLCDPFVPTSVLDDSLPPDDAPRPPFGFGPPFPNPTHAGANFQFALTAEDLAIGTRVEIQIHNVAGRLVTTIPGQNVVGVQNLFWDGKIDNGREAPDGIYYVNLIAGNQKVARKLLRLNR